VAPDAGLLDYVFYGHVFETASKRDSPPRGLAGLERAAAALAAAGMPVVAIGGLMPERVRDVLRAGVYGVAAVSGIWDVPDAAAAAERYLEALEEGA
jgi:thiazole tautomerase (transcriptional regulator TenI)